MISRPSIGVFEDSLSLRTARVDRREFVSLSASRSRSVAFQRSGLVSARLVRRIVV